LPPKLKPPPDIGLDQEKLLARSKGCAVEKSRHGRKIGVGRPASEVVRGQTCAEFGYDDIFGDVVA
jgi:hypothetical protein